MNTFLPFLLAGEAPSRRAQRWPCPRNRPICPIRRTFPLLRDAEAVFCARKLGSPPAALAPSTALAPLWPHVPADERAVLAQHVIRGQSTNASASVALVLGHPTRSERQGSDETKSRQLQMLRPRRQRQLLARLVKGAPPNLPWIVIWALQETRSHRPNPLPTPPLDSTRIRLRHRHLGPHNNPPLRLLTRPMLQTTNLQQRMLPRIRRRKTRTPKTIHSNERARTTTSPEVEERRVHLPRIQQFPRLEKMQQGADGAGPLRALHLGSHWRHGLRLYWHKPRV